jgi:hypothetical protein
MLADYRRLKAATGLVATPELSLFERYCRRAAPAMDAMEWSWKFSGWTSVANRVFWLGSSRHRDVTRRALRWLATEMDLARDEADRDWLALTDTHMDRALVAYSGPNPFTGRAAVIKIYLTLNRCTPSLYRRIVRPAAPHLPPEPPGAGAILLCRTMDADRDTSSARVYALFNQRDLRRPRVASFLTRTIGARGLAAASMYPRSGIGLKADGTDMLGIGLRPTGRRQLNPAHLLTPVMVPLVNAAVRTPVLSERINDVTWVTIPIDRTSLGFPRKMREMNVYAQLRHR